jgi:hypothetical protein
MTSLSVTTNISLADSDLIQFTIPNWIRVFGNRLKEVVIVVDPQRLTGRLGSQYKNYAKLDQLMARVEMVRQMDRRIRVSMLKEGEEMNAILRRWFIRGYPIRCQSGTPIAAFIQALEEGSEDLVLRCDCDMLFFEAGFLEKAREVLIRDEFDIIEPPLLGFDGGTSKSVSLGAFMAMRSHLSENCLPIRPHRLGIIRCIHRLFKGRPVYLNLEEMVAIEKRKGAIKHCNLDQSLGCSLHIYRRDDVLLPGFINLVRKFERGSISHQQRLAGRNFEPTLWEQSYWI